MIPHFGLALKNTYIEEILLDLDSVEPKLQRIDSVEVIAENFIRGKESLRKSFDQLSAKLPTSIHCLTLSPGGISPLDKAHAIKVRDFADRVNATHITDHLCFSSFEEIESNSLLPVPFTSESLQNVVRRIDQIQEILKRPFGLENTSYFFHFPDNEMSEADFISELVRKTGCSILLDVNNVIVSSFNTSQSKTYEEALGKALRFIQSIPADQIIEIHVAGHTLRQKQSLTYLIDNHGAWPQDEVLVLLKEILLRCKPKSVILERDQNVPPLKELIDELIMIKEFVIPKESQAENLKRVDVITL